MMKRRDKTRRKSPMPRRSVLKLLVFFLVVMGYGALTGTPEIQGFSSADIHLSANAVAQGGVALVVVDGKEGETRRVWWQDHEVFLIPNGSERLWQGFLGVDLNAAPGRYPLVVKALPEGREETVMIDVVKKDRGTRRLTLPKGMVDLDAEALERVRKESRIMKEALDAPVSIPLWRGPFIRPIEGEIVGPFGRRSIINDQPRAPHSGVDLTAPEGTPVKAMNHGRVVLTVNHFFTGKSVVIDHGGGILSMYFHLDKILVKRDHEVKKGEPIGLVGATGRATGPHLHLAVRINGARVDPLSLTELSKELE